MSATEEFAFLLAHELGIADPYKMMELMPAATFNAWRQFWQKNPFGPKIEWMQMAQTVVAIVNSAPFRGKDAPAAKIDDFMPPDPDKKPGGALAKLSESEKLRLGARLAGGVLAIPGGL